MKLVKLESERLLYRKFDDNDFAAVHAFMGDGGNMRLMLMSPCSEEESRGYISAAIAFAGDDGCAEFHFAVVLKETGKVVGTAILMNQGINSEIGWILRRDLWNKGYGTELGKTLLDFGFGSLGLRRITARCDAENTGSYRVMEKIGMRREGLFVKGRLGNAVLGHELRDELHYAVLREEWARTRREPHLPSERAKI